MSRPPITRANPYTPRRGQFAEQTFHSERQYRNALARSKGFASWGAQQAASKHAYSSATLSTFRPAEREAARRALAAVNDKRHDQRLSLEAAAKSNQTTVAAMKRYGGPALTKTASGRYIVKPYDRLVRRLHFPTVTGTIPLDIRDSRSASKLAAYWNARNHFRDTGDDRPLRKFQGKGVTVDKRFYPFVTDLDLIEQLAKEGEVSFEDLYADAV